MPVCIYRTLAVRAEYYALLLGKGEKVKKNGQYLYSNNCPPSWRKAEDRLLFSVPRAMEKHRIRTFQHLLCCACGGFNNSKTKARMLSVPNI